MAITDLFAGEIAVELIKELAKVCRKCSYCKSNAEDLMSSIKQLDPIIKEIRYSGIELPQDRQSQLSELADTLVKGRELAQKVLASNRWNVYKNVQFARKMDKLEKVVSRFINVPLQAHVLADVHHVRSGVERLEQSLGVLRIGMGSGGGGGGGDGGLGFFEEAMKRKVEEELRERNSVNLVGAGMVLAKKKVKEMILGREDLGVIGICGMGGSGKTTLATAISKDPEILGYFNNRVFFETVSQSPNIEQLKQTLWKNIAGIGMVDSNFLDPPWPYQRDGEFGGGGGRRALVILDDVWSLSHLVQLTSSIHGCKILVVSRFKFQTVFNYTYELELLREDEALTLFCYSAFGQKSVPRSADRKLVEEVVKECKGLPLALKVIGASLRDQHQLFWKSAKNRLSRGEPVDESHDNLLDRMAISVRYLPEKVRECFLDLASFPEDKKIPLDVLINIWVEIHDIDEEEAFAILTELSDKNLITLVKDARAADTYGSAFEVSVTQHDVLRDMALHLSSRDRVTDRRRLLMPRREEGLPKEWERNMDKRFQAQIISIHTGEMKEWDWFSMDFPEAEVLILNFSSGEYYLPPFIDRMPKLKALVLINYGDSNSVLDNYSVFSSIGNLRSLWLEKINLPSVPITTVPLRNLRKLSVVLCQFAKCSDGSKLDMPLILPRLVELTMDHCISVTGLTSSICMITSLKSLSITNCHDLHDLPTELGNLSSLRVLRFSACPTLEKLPQSICGLDKLEYLDISQCVNLRCLPEQMGGMTRLEKIDMRECSQIRKLPSSAFKLKRLHRVICDEEASWFWREVEMEVPDLQVEVAEECFNLDWLSE